MKQWKLTYELLNLFSSPVTGHSYSLRLFPREMISQKVGSCQCVVYPCSGASCRSRDSFGNPLLIGLCEEPHTSFQVRVEAFVRTEDAPEPENADYFRLGKYRYATEFTKMGEQLGAFYETLPAPGREDDWGRTERIMDIFWNSFQYVTGSTNFHTKAEEAFSQGCGVCQDYAHILLAVLRRERITARYVAGAIPGEGESHAWVEVYQDGFWKGFDPTHNRPANDEYIRFAVGRDAMDCPLSQGIFRGGASQMQQVCVKMEEC